MSGGVYGVRRVVSESSVITKFKSSSKLEPTAQCRGRPCTACQIPALNQSARSASTPANHAAATAAPPAPTCARRTAAFAPGDPSAAQSRHAAYISTTNAWPSGLSLPLLPTESGLTTGVSHMSAVKCASAAAVPLAAGAVLVLVRAADPDEEEEEEAGAESALRLCSASGRCV